MRSIFVVNADDLGLAESANRGIFQAHANGIVTSASLVVTTSAFQHALRGIAENPDLGIGLHFSLSAGRCVSSPSDVPSLIDADGFLNCRFASLLFALKSSRRGSLLQQIEMELEAQIGRMSEVGLKPDHINGERHIHLLPGIIDAVRRSAAKHEIGHVRLINDVGLSYLRPRDFAGSIVNGGLIKYALLQYLTNTAEAGWPKQQYNEVNYASMLFTGRMDKLLPRIWEDPPPGITELAVHPGIPGEESYDGLGNPELAQYLQSEHRKYEMDGCIETSKRATSALLSTFAGLQKLRSG